MADENGGAPAVAEPAADGNGTPAGLIQIPDDTPDELRPILESYIKEKVDPQVTQRFQEAAQLRDKFGPFADVEGLDQLDPETMSSLVEFANMSQEDFSSWYGETAKKLAEQDPEGFETMWTQMGTELGYFDDDEEPGGGQDDPRVQKLESTIEELEGKLNGFLGQQDQADAQKAADAALDAEMGELTKAHNEGEKFDEEFEQDLWRMASAFSNEEQPLHKAFERLQRLSGQAQSELVRSKLDQPKPANSGGQANTSPDRYSRISDTHEAALARMKAATAP